MLIQSRQLLCKCYIIIMTVKFKTLTVDEIIINLEFCEKHINTNITDYNTYISAEDSANGMHLPDYNTKEDKI